ncbi:hypothetical protein ABT297_22270 [Dactylosporangium sp. NPDC000555]|uniref:hypothetical protein n=1 Tax=Dactylosporangium sp. NPDC000555 TaxID=3154260 RepID=UPI003324AF7E
MEPGHPPRQDPPTEHSHDQVNGSPPRPASRRGWMSDSPLDGGSGWPTSAYAVVPRQAAAPVEESAPVPPPAEEPEPVARTSRKGRIAVLLVGLVVLVIAAAGGVLATRDDSAKDGTGSTTQSPGAPTGKPALPVADPSAMPSGSANGGGAGGASASAWPSAGPSADPSGAAGPSAGASAPPAALPATAVLRAGTAQLAVLAGQPDEAYDFDTGSKQTAGADVTAGVIGLSAANGARLAVLLTSDTPSLATCSAVPAGQWTGQVVLASLLPGSKVCVRTSEDRYAWFMTRAGELVNGAVYSANLDFIVYKKAGDQG